MRKVLIPVDGSDCARDTLTWAAETLDKATTRYFLLHVVKLLPEIPTEEYEIEDAMRLLEEMQIIMRRHGCTVEQAEYIVGDPGDSICAYAQAKDVDQVLIGSHGRSGLARLILGSVSSYVLEHCDKPVFVYRHAERKAENQETMSPNKML